MARRQPPDRAAPGLRPALERAAALGRGGRARGLPARRPRGRAAAGAAALGALRRGRPPPDRGRQHVPPGGGASRRGGRAGGRAAVRRDRRVRGHGIAARVLGRGPARRGGPAHHHLGAPAHDRRARRARARRRGPPAAGPDRGPHRAAPGAADHDDADRLLGAARARSARVRGPVRDGARRDRGRERRARARAGVRARLPRAGAGLPRRVPAGARGHGTARAPVSSAPDPYQPLGVVHLLRPWGEPAADLEQLQERLGQAPGDVLFAHTLRGLLRDAGGRGPGMDDLSLWVAAGLQDPGTAERMWFAASSAEPGAEPVRAALLGVLASLPEKHRLARRAPDGGEFRFLSAVPLTYRVGLPREAAGDVLEALLGDDLSVWFHHLHEERWRTGERPTVLGWLEASGEARVAGWLEETARSRLPVELARRRLRIRLRMTRAASRLGETPPARDDERAAARLAARKLARHLAGEDRRS